MTADELDALEELERAATAGPWYVRELNDEMCMGAVAISTQPDAEDELGFRSGDWPGHEIVAACLIQSPAYVAPEDNRFNENARLIASMRTMLPYLLRFARLGLERADR